MKTFLIYVTSLCKINKLYNMIKVRQNQYFLPLNFQGKMLKNLKSGNIQTKQHTKVRYLGCLLDEAMTLSGIHNKQQFVNSFP